eukprot:CAMPEP_0185855752 /NCGR_PEP_ID=MMETSP1354-20130828/26768_1 /TAXON_ID=708628 /ORGANISM="Erythrolobus madagascarensis, Strain CCMP3276" /LENGTH=194 /DNA_ID=CAMNT_0028557839 /DNA_START=252 /DNA_END=833 /DNA_ORIENTATION=+
MAAIQAFDSLAVKLVGSKISSRSKSRIVCRTENEKMIDMCSEYAFDMVHSMRDGIKVKDRLVALKMERNTVLGSEIVSWLVRTRVAQSREEAEQIGAEMVEYGHLYPVGSDEESSFTSRFSRRAVPFRFSCDDRDVSKLFSHEEMSALGAKFVADMSLCYCKSISATTLPDVFTGADATTYLLNAGYAKNRSEA